jgi:hypothetical protein
MNCPPHTLSTILIPLDASGRLSRLMAASSPGAFMAPQMARRFRSAILSVISAIHTISRAAPRRRSMSRCLMARFGSEKRWQGECYEGQV